MELGVTHLFYKENKNIISISEVVLKERGFMNVEGDYEFTQVGGNVEDYVPGQKRCGWDR